MKKVLFMTAIMAGSLFMPAKGQAVIIENKTRIEGMGEMADILVNEIFHFDTIHVTIVYMPLSNSYEGGVHKDPDQLHTYTVWIKPNQSRKQIFLGIAHEFIHICQSEREGLYVYGDIWEWDGEWGSMTYTPYKDRGWEKDAYNRQYAVRNELLRIYNERNP